MNSTNDSATLMLEEICYNYLGPIVCAFGILCNILNLLILTERALKESPYSYLTALACVDLSALTMMFIHYVFARKDPFNYYWRFYEAHLYYPLVNFCTNSSVWLIVLMTIERFLFVCHPLWAKIYCDRPSAILKISSVLIFIGIINIPRFLVFRVDFIYSVEDPKYKLISTHFRQTDFFVVANWFYSIVINFVPLTVLCISNVYLVYAVQQARAQRQVLQMRNNKEATWNREQKRLTITLISIICLFIICIMPSAFADFHSAYALFGRGQPVRQFKRSPPYRILQTVSNVLVCCNLSLNFVLYCAFNDKFVRVFKMMVARWKKTLQKDKSFHKMKTKKSTLNGNLSLSLTGSVTPPSRMTTVV